MIEQRILISTPIGKLLLIGDAKVLRQVLFESQTPKSDGSGKVQQPTGAIA